MPGSADAQARRQSAGHPNPDVSKRGQPLGGLIMAGSLERVKGSTTKWEDGWVYDPDSGDTYTAEMKLDCPDTLKLRGFVGISLLGRTMTWTREPAGGATTAVPRPRRVTLYICGSTQHEQCRLGWRSAVRVPRLFSGTRRGRRPRARHSPAL